MAAKALMVQGTGSSVGKSLMTAALCRILVQDGYRVRPFKAQNMSNNADVTTEGGEIGRAQAEQARAARVEPSVLMNPVLLRPTTDIGAQVIVLGKAAGTMTAREYQAFKPRLRPIILDALRQLMDQADIVVIEGAGSPAEVNLKDDDVVNMWIARQVNAPVLLVGDIDRGGVFAQLVGTMELLDEMERRLVRGFVINKFRGDCSLLEPGIRWLERRCGLPVIGTIPYLHDVELAEEDSIAERWARSQPVDGEILIEVVRVPRISNVTDFDALRREPDVELRFIDRPASGVLPDCLMLPGSKSTIADLAFIRARGLDRHLQRCRAAGAEIVGICGGFQMLGQEILDPNHVEATVSAAPGLGVLPVKTTFGKDKLVAQTRGVHLESGLPVTGYEIHLGRMSDASSGRPVLKITQRASAATEQYDGLVSDDARTWGTHVHGLFDAPSFRRWWLNRLRARKGLPERLTETVPSEEAYDRLADAVRPHLSMTTLYHLIGCR